MENLPIEIRLHIIKLAIMKSKIEKFDKLYGKVISKIVYRASLMTRAIHIQLNDRMTHHIQYSAKRLRFCATSYVGDSEKTRYEYEVIFGKHVHRSATFRRKIV